MPEVSVTVVLLISLLYYGVAVHTRAFGSYKQVAPGIHEPFNVHVVEISDGRISGLHHFLYPELFAAFDLPARLERQ